jgi:adenylate kinase family enzyme
MVKIRIVGAPGSGKTYLARKLSREFDIRTYRLDDIYFPTDADFEIGKQIRNAFISSDVRKEHWIIEGAHIDDITEKTFEHSDMIILLNPEMKERRKRIIKRFLRWSVSNPMNMKFALLKNQLGWNKTYDEKDIKKINREKYKEKIKEYSNADAAFSEITALVKSS